MSRTLSSVVKINLHVNPYGGLMDFLHFKFPAEVLSISYLNNEKPHFGHMTVAQAALLEKEVSVWEERTLILEVVRAQFCRGLV